MFAVSAVYPSGKIQLIGFAASPREAEDIVAKVMEANGGEDRVKQLGIRFNAELAM